VGGKQGPLCSLGTVPAHRAWLCWSPLQDRLQVAGRRGFREPCPVLLAPAFPQGLSLELPQMAGPGAKPGDIILKKA
jgi:hypothetical protein